MNKITIENPKLTQILFEPKGSLINVAILLPISKTISAFSSSVVKYEVDKFKEMLPQLKDVYIDETNSGEFSLIAKFRIKSMLYSMKEFVETLYTCHHIAFLLRTHFEILQSLRNSQKDLKPFSKEYIEDDQERLKSTAEEEV